MPLELPAVWTCWIAASLRVAREGELVERLAVRAHRRGAQGHERRAERGQALDRGVVPRVLVLVEQHRAGLGVA